MKHSILLHQIKLALIIILFNSCQNDTSVSLKQLQTSDTLDLGFVQNSSNTKIKIPLFNPNSSRIIVKNYFADCGCTQIKLFSDTILPNETVHLVGYYNPGINKDSGLIIKKIGILTNCDTPLRIISIKANVFK